MSWLSPELPRATPTTSAACSRMAPPSWPARTPPSPFGPAGPSKPLKTLWSMHPTGSATWRHRPRRRRASSRPAATGRLTRHRSPGQGQRGQAVAALDRRSRGRHTSAPLNIKDANVGARGRRARARATSVASRRSSARASRTSPRLGQGRRQTSRHPLISARPTSRRSPWFRGAARNPHGHTGGRCRSVL